MPYLITFSPWIVYAVIPRSAWLWAGLTALVLTAAVTVWGLALRRRPVDSMIIELSSLVFFAGVVVTAAVAPDSVLHEYAPALSSGWLAVVSWLSLAVRRPFTLGIAKLTTPRELWDHPVFRRTNTIITLVWAAAFTVGATLLAVLADAGPLDRLLVQVAHFVLPMVFTVRYVAVVRARAAARGARVAGPQSAR